MLKAFFLEDINMDNRTLSVLNYETYSKLPKDEASQEVCMGKQQKLLSHSRNLCTLNTTNTMCKRAGKLRSKHWRT